MATLRKAPGTPTALGSYEIGGSLAGLAPGRRTVRMLRVRGLTGASGEGLRPLRGLPDLRELTLDELDGVDLAPLAGLPLELLSVRDSRTLDLAPLAQLPALELLLLYDVADCRAPGRLTLPETLAHLTVIVDGPLVEALVHAIDWARLTNLFVLKLGVSDRHAPPIELNLGFLQALPQLGLLDLGTAIRPARTGPRLLEPPFDALPPRLGQLRVSAPDPEAATARLERHRAELAVAVYPCADEPEPPWTPAEVSRGWTAYGRLLDAFPHAPDEYAAADAAEAALHTHDPALHRRLDFDPEQDGTGISAGSREDLDAALAILGVRG